MGFESKEKSGRVLGGIKHLAQALANESTSSKDLAFALAVARCKVLGEPTPQKIKRSTETWRVVGFEQHMPGIDGCYALDANAGRINQKPVYARLSPDHLSIAGDAPRLFFADNFGTRFWAIARGFNREWFRVSCPRLSFTEASKTSHGMAAAVAPILTIADLVRRQGRRGMWRIERAAGYSSNVSCERDKISVTKLDPRRAI